MELEDEAGLEKVIQSMYALNGPKLSAFDVIIYKSCPKSWDIEFMKYLVDLA